MAQARLHLPVACWPDEDRQRFAAAFRKGSTIFDDAGPGAHLRPATVRAICFGWRRWLGWIERTDPALLMAPAEVRITPQRVRDFIQHLQESNGSVSTAAIIARLYDGARYLIPEGEWGWLKILKTRLEKISKPRTRMPILITSGRLFQLGIDLMTAAEAEARESEQPSSAAAIHYRDGLLVALASWLPMRRTNLAGLVIGTSLIHEGPVWLIDIPGGSTKNKRAIQATVLGELGRHFDRYLAHFRPAIHRSSQHTGFWASAKGSPMTGSAIYLSFVRAVRLASGLQLRLHDVRSIASTTWALNEPETSAGAADLLADRSERVIELHYRRTQAIAACRAFNRIITARRAERRAG